ncbi:DUF309 domain-containing protein [Halobacillus locisalis]|uniref:DUF309 domain-containing protein n=1 Tax=Halobacillus locisalis TaxID=220753 RepID=A0A838CPQ5_9BACI|nr:DUF309 domain-containing protein [Halobacillus locisalis]MBA2173819.1 DUF309 domain-containing protein [Halobacillus locisalis]
MYPTHYIEFLAHFHGTRDYFECHEVLEEYWKDNDLKNRESVWVFLIQVAVGFYHHRRGNFRGAEKLMKRSQVYVERHGHLLPSVGLDKFEMKELIRCELKLLSNSKPYQSIQLPITDPQLLRKVRTQCVSWRVPFNQPSPMDEALIDKHRLRNR